MKLLKSTSLLLALLMSLAFAKAQKIETSEIDLPLSKEAQKAAKKGTLLNAGSYWNADRSLQYNFFVYQPKGQGLMYDVITIETKKGKIKSQKTEAYTAENLSQYDLQASSQLSGEAAPELAGADFAYFKKTLLAGNPSLIHGQFENRYVNGLWAGYSFDKGEESKLNERFWPFFSFAVEEGVSNSHYLLRRRTTVMRILTGGKNYIPADGKAFVGGLMATSGANQFLSGIYNLKSQSWDHKVITTLEEGLQPLDYLPTASGGVYCLIHSASSYFVLELDARGEVLRNIPLEIPMNKNYQYTSFRLLEAEEGVFVVGNHLDKPATGLKAGVCILQVSGDKAAFQQMHDFEQIKASLKAAPKNKAKFKNTAIQQFESIEQLPNGDWLLLYNSGMIPFTNYAMQLSPDGALKQTYQVDPIGDDGKPNDRMGTGSTHLPTQVLAAGEDVYLLLRTVPQAMDQGIQSSAVTGDNFKITTTVRIDEIRSVGKIVKINPANQSISNVVAPDQTLVGENPAELSASGTVILHTLDSKKKSRSKLLIN